jgi:transposase
MLERVRKDSQNPYAGGNSIFYQRVQGIRQEKKMTKQNAIWRFEGLPGEYLQVDWGERRQFPFTQIPRTTRYCFVARLKYSRWIYTEFHDNMRYETLIRCILRCFESLGGMPWVLVFDNMKTVTLGVNYDHPSKSAKARLGLPNWRFIQMQKLCKATFAANLTRTPWM